MSKTVFVAVLDWGLGHATRCVPVIRELQKQSCKVVVGGSGTSLKFLKSEFNGLTFYDLPEYNITYPSNGRLVQHLIPQMPNVMRQIQLEHKLTLDIIKKENIDCIISDNRYGCFSNAIKSIFICHQLNLQLPGWVSFLSRFINHLHLKRIGKFNEVWVPDEEQGFRFSGKLSVCKLNNVKWIGILSRFSSSQNSDVIKYDVAALVSGPEPQRTNFENMLRQQLLNSNKRSILIKGKPGSSQFIVNGPLTEVDHLDSKELESVLRSASVVICRSGYSSIMDLAVLGKKVIFVPTPGQTEQEYLAKYFGDKSCAVVRSQNEFNLQNALMQIDRVSSIQPKKPNANLGLVIHSI